MWISKRRLNEITKAAYDQGISVGYGFRTQTAETEIKTDVPEVYLKAFKDKPSNGI